MSEEWKPISTAPPGYRLQLWWTPVNDNPYAENVVFGIVSDHEPGKFWTDCGSYASLDRITHWRYPPEPPPARLENEHLAHSNERMRAAQRQWLDYIASPDFESAAHLERQDR